MGLLFYRFGILPCVRVRCGLYPHVECVSLCELVVRCACVLGKIHHSLS